MDKAAASEISVAMFFCTAMVCIAWLLIVNPLLLFWWGLCVVALAATMGSKR